MKWDVDKKKENELTEEEEKGLSNGWVIQLDVEYREKKKRCKIGRLKRVEESICEKGM